uniref:Uncharacterized protein n=1 Tax=Lepeophtheirus salmonis TaxID=72036 RepID=A0A0K2T9J1_LEPSM
MLRLRKSAVCWTFPGMYFIVKSYLWSFSLNRCILNGKSTKECFPNKFSNGLWSVSISNLFPSTYSAK